MKGVERYQHYEILRREDGSLWELGRGAMGVTYKAYDTNLRCAVALKVINSVCLESESVRERFLREARAAATLRHPNVASVFAVGTDGSNYFYATEFIDGETVDATVKRIGHLEPAEALDIALQVSRALAAAARQNLVHCDLKPSNLMLVDEDGEKIVKLTDFSLAKSVGLERKDSGTLTCGGGFVGTPHFASPEQIEERDIDIRSDIYSLGATLYYMVTGRPPFLGSVGQIMSQHLYESVPLEPQKGLPLQVASLIQSMMEKDPGKRPQNPAELHRKILNCLRELPATGMPRKDPEPPLEKEVALGVIGRPTQSLPDENVHFTVYRPREITPVWWYKMLIFTHLDERPEWLDVNEAPPLEQVEDEAHRILGDRLESYRKITEESRLTVRREGEITLVPEMQGIEFNPRKRSFLWKDGLCVHLETFELRARPDFVVPTLVRGRVTIFLGHLILAEVALSIRVNQSKAPAALARLPSESSSARRFRRIFASYSHRDLEIVKEMERYALGLGDRYLRDSVYLRAGESWHQGLLGMISEADIFQLFWSWNSSQSPYVEREWRHALSLRREMFIRPTYWEDPWPDPPDPLRPIHFQRIDVGTASASAAPQSDTTTMTVTLLDLLRVRGVLSAPEVVRLLNFLAPLADNAIGNQLGQVDFTLSGIHLTFRGLTGSESRSDLLQRPLTAWEHLELNVDAIELSFLPCHTEKQPGSVTQIRGAPDIGPPGCRVRLFSLLAYELLGGPRVRVESTGHYLQIAALTSGGNAVLRRGLTGECSSAAELARQFAAAVGLTERVLPGRFPAESVSAPAPPQKAPHKGANKGLLLIALIVLIGLLLFGYLVSRWLVR
jgi:serine/threonine protein kinase